MRKQKEYHYIYKTTCNINGKYYIGMHSTDKLDDGYMGSGKRLWNSFNYHGKGNHSTEILEFCEDRVALRKQEKKIVNEDLLKEDLCMNLMVGGEGGSSPAQREWTIQQWKKPEYRAKMGKLSSERMKKTHRDGKIIPPDTTGRKHSEETKEKMRKPKNVGKTNSQYGTCWITKEGINKKIKKEVLNTYIKDGWVKGRNNVRF
jgi:hypothetical protein